jgi:hypothetical protein
MKNMERRRKKGGKCKKEDKRKVKGKLKLK